jgi:hypothetical protein
MCIYAVLQFARFVLHVLQPRITLINFFYSYALHQYKARHTDIKKIRMLIIFWLSTCKPESGTAIASLG